MFSSTLFGFVDYSFLYGMISLIVLLGGRRSRLLCSMLDRDKKASSPYCTTTVEAERTTDLYAILDGRWIWLRTLVTLEA